MQNQPSSQSAKQNLEILYDLRCEHGENPTGIHADFPRLSWKIGSASRGMRQTAYRILVAYSEQQLDEEAGEVWDSGWIKSEQSLNVRFEENPLIPIEKYYWKVKIRDQKDREFPWSEHACWTTGKRNQDWGGVWIGRGEPVEEDEGLPIFRKDFTITKPVCRSQISVCGLGQYVLSLNGKQVGDDFLAPAWSVYEKTVYYNTFDPTELLQNGENTFGIMLGKGFYNTQGDRRIHGVQTRGALKLIFECTFFHDDGSTTKIVSDTSWKNTAGPISHSAILAGEDHDARRLPESWDKPGFNDSSWSNSRDVPSPSGQLKPSISPPMREFESYAPSKIEALEGGDYIYDFGQNISAIPHLKTNGRAGQKIRITPAEQRHGQDDRTNNGKGSVNQAGVGSNNYYEYTRSGDGLEEWKPRFTYGGFQYLQISGAVPATHPNPSNLPVIEVLESIHIRNSTPEAGLFECSNPLFNRIDKLIDLAVRSNFSHVLTDCPTREKLGWLEAAYLMGPAISRRYDLIEFYAKITKDIRDAQEEDGRIFTVAPNYPYFKGGFRYSPEWGAAGVILPWQLYHWYGDEQFLAENYRMMKGFVDYLETHSTGLVPESGLGDWFDYGHGKTLGAAVFTPPELTAMASFFQCASIMAEGAEVLGLSDDFRRYGELAVQIKTAFNKKFFNGKNEYENNGSPQTANAMALSIGLVDEEFREAVVQFVVDDLKKRNYQQTAGDIGFYYLVDALAEAGLHDVLYENVNRHEEGSYGFILDHGWNSMPEAWDAHTEASMNHCMLGHIQKWFYHGLLGIHQTSDSTAFKKILIAPAFPKKLNQVCGYYDSIYGRIVVEWKRGNSILSLNIEIPPNTEALVYLPATAISCLAEGGKSLDQTEAVQLVGLEKGQAKIRIESGRYSFTSKLH